MTRSRPDPAGGAGNGPEIACGRCGRGAVGPAPTWTWETADGAVRWLCESCTRENVRSIEGHGSTTPGGEGLVVRAWW